MPPTVRPLSPHLQVYRWQIQMATSVLHRATGIVLFLGSFIIAAGLLCLAAGPESWVCFTGLAKSWLGLVVLFGWTWTLAYHLMNGIRHLIQDAGRGYAIEQFVRSSWISVIGSLFLTGIVWGFVIARGGLA
jgi:succinate dehydrogenase / fumarate reductase cytochrome b subunit